MATIRTTCPDCTNHVETTTRIVKVIDLANGASTYRFTCPICRHIVIKDADECTRKLLVDGGCEVLTIDAPRELRPTGAAPLNYDDCIDLHRRWADEATFVADVESLDAA